MLVTTNKSATTAEEKSEWRTPPDLFARLDQRYGPFDLDVAARAANTLCVRWLGPGSEIAEDALDTDWIGVAFGNPPYGRGQVARFVAKAASEAAAGHCQATLLLPAATDQAWFHEHVWHNRRGRAHLGVEVEFLRGRVRFLLPDGTTAGSPTFASVVVTFNRTPVRRTP